MSNQIQHMDVRVDVIVNSLKELQQERSNLDTKLNELRRKRFVVEKNVESLTGRYLQHRDVNSKLNDTLQVAQQKVNNTQQAIDALQKKCHAASKENQQLVDQAERTKSQEMEIMREFENQIVNMIEKFKYAQVFYRVDNLKKEITDCEKMHQEFETSAIETSQQTASLCDQFQRMNMEARAHEDMAKNLEIQPDVQELVIQVITRSREDLELQCNEQDARNDKLKEENLQLETKISQMQNVQWEISLFCSNCRFFHQYFI